MSEDHECSVVGAFCGECGRYRDDEDAEEDKTPLEVVTEEDEENQEESPKRQSKMEEFYAREGERNACLTFCRDTITRLADKANLQKPHIETLMADRVSKQTV